MRETWYMAKCRDCAPPLAMPFSVEAERLVWCQLHKLGHKGLNQPNTVIDQYEELERYRTVLMVAVHTSSKTTTIVCGHVDCDREDRTITVSCVLGDVVRVQDVLNAIDAHYQERHDDA